MQCCQIVLHGMRSPLVIIIITITALDKLDPCFMDKYHSPSGSQQHHHHNHHRQLNQPTNHFSLCYNNCYCLAWPASVASLNIILFRYDQQLLRLPPYYHHHHGESFH